MTELQLLALRPLGLAPQMVGPLAACAAAGGCPMRVVQTQRDCFTLHDGCSEHDARLHPRVLDALRAADDALTVGDWVVAAQERGEWWIHERVAPVTQVARRANDGRRQPLASNVDTALLVMGLDADFNPRRMERYIAMVRACGVAPVAVLTKADLDSEAAARAGQLRLRLAASVPVVALDARDGQARLALAPWLHEGQTLVLLGSSGAGKSTLTNTLVLQPLQDTGAVRRGDGRGRHTTTARSLLRCPEGACIIDTPGLRTWRPDADEVSLAAAFGDVAALASRCRFRDCRHQGEPGCAVREGVDADRLANFQKLLRDARRADATPLERIEARRKWKRLGKAGAERSREKRG